MDCNIPQTNDGAGSRPHPCSCCRVCLTLLPRGCPSNSHTQFSTFLAAWLLDPVVFWFRSLKFVSAPLGTWGTNSKSGLILAIGLELSSFDFITFINAACGYMVGFFS